MTVLSTLAVVTSELLFTYEGSAVATGWMTDDKLSEAGFAIWYIGWDVDVVINAFSIFLSFDYNNHLYVYWCCGLHRCCMYVCDKCSRKRQVAHTNDLEVGLLSL